MSVLTKTYDLSIPFDWVDTNHLPDSISQRMEVYLKGKQSINSLKLLFTELFYEFEKELIIYDKSWGNFCLDTWNIKSDEYDYSLYNKSLETMRYLKMLDDSAVEVNYSGCCICNDWDLFLDITLNCVVNHIAPFGHLIFHKTGELFFYFHHSYSIGIYYKEENEVVLKLLKEINSNENLNVIKY